MNIEFVLNVVMFCISTIIDVLLVCVIFYLLFKVLRIKTKTTENNREIHEHDKVIFDLQEKIEKIK